MVSNFSKSSRVWKDRLNIGHTHALLWLFIHYFNIFSFHLGCNMASKKREKRWEGRPRGRCMVCNVLKYHFGASHHKFTLLSEIVNPTCKLHLLSCVESSHTYSCQQPGACTHRFLLITVKCNKMAYIVASISVGLPENHRLVQER